MNEDSQFLKDMIILMYVDEQTQMHHVPRPTWPGRPQPFGLVAALGDAFRLPRDGQARWPHPHGMRSLGGIQDAGDSHHIACSMTKKAFEM